MYLNDWFCYDKGFVEGIAANNEQSRSTIYEAAKYYQVTRNFRVRNDEPRFKGVLDELTKIEGPLTDKNVDSEVATLASRFETKYGTNAVSAASKFLWLRFKSPVVIFDSRASTWLRSNGYAPDSGYANYRKRWIEAYDFHKEAIQSACADLASMRLYSLAYNETENTVSQWAMSQWFQERVFDKFLWFNGRRDPHVQESLFV